jgi:predicted RNA-binding protein associated with RNAse of E/G family
MDDNDNVLYWYCDIIQTDIDKETNTLTFNDLLVDVLVYPDGFVKVVDIDEVAIAVRDNILDKTTIEQLMMNLDKLLNIIYNGEFDKYKSCIETL